jgi:hypothetical protein
MLVAQGAVGPGRLARALLFLLTDHIGNRQLREIGIEAQQIADAAGRYLAAPHFAAR